MVSTIESTLTKMSNLNGSFFYINICGFINRNTFYMRPEYLTIAISDLKFNFPPLIVPR